MDFPGYHAKGCRACGELRNRRELRQNLRCAIIAGSFISWEMPFRRGFSDEMDMFAPSPQGRLQMTSQDPGTKPAWLLRCLDL
jgi:hypothetical protein